MTSLSIMCTKDLTGHMSLIVCNTNLTYTSRKRTKKGALVVEFNSLCGGL